MALVIEDGTAKDDAQSYVTVAEAIAELTAQGETTFTAKTTTDQEIDLYNGALYLESLLAGNLNGTKVSKTQGLSLPRTGFTDAEGFTYDATEIPAQFKKAQISAASLVASGAITIGSPATGSIKEESFQVGPIKEKTVYVDPGKTGGFSVTGLESVPAIDALLSTFTTSGTTGGGFQGTALLG